jgi:virginiamycin B lyase
MVITEHQIGPDAYGVAITPDGTVWTTLVNRGEVAALYPDGNIARVSLGSELSRPMIIICDPAGSLWFSRGDGAIGRIEATGSIVSQPVPTADGSPYGLCLGPDGESVWYTLIAGNRIGRIKPDGRIDEFPVAGGGMPSLITAGPDGALWFTLNQADAIGKITVDGEITTYPLPTRSAAPVGIHTSDDALWFTEIGAGQLGRITPDGQIREFPLPDRASRPHAIASTANGGCWATLWATSAIVEMDRNGEIISQAGFGPGAEPHSLAIAPDTSVWVALEKGALAHVSTNP